MLIEKIGKGIALVTAANGISGLFSLITAFVLIREMSPAAFGTVSLLLAVYAIIITVLDPGIDAVVVPDVAREIGEKNWGRARAIIRAYAKFQLAAGITIGAAIIAALVLFSNYVPAEVVPSLYLFGAWVVFTGARNVFSVLFYSHSNFKNYFLLEATDSVARFLLTVVLVVLLGWGITGALVAYACGTVVAILATSGRFWNGWTKLREHQIDSNYSLYRDLFLKHGKYSTVNAFLKKLGDNAPPFLAKYFFGVSAVGLYTTAQKAVSVFTIAISSAETTLMPVISQEIGRGREWMNEAYNRLMKYSLLLSATIFILAEVIADSLGLVFGENYAPAVLIFRVLALLIFVQGLTIAQRPFLISNRKQAGLLVSNLAYLLSVIIATVALVPIAGILSLPLALVLGQLVSAVLQAVLLKKMNLELKTGKLFTFDYRDREILRFAYGVVKRNVRLQRAV